jgi:ribulose-5-phosphate 4-epimerase/fuculose-1-phosphate aldolase
MSDEGYLKFSLQWDERPVEIPGDIFAALQVWRTRLYEAGVVGAYPDGIGFGNLSQRAPQDGPAPGSGNGPVRFYITGSATGGLPVLSRAHYALVTDYDLAHNTLACRGGTKASSESLSHAAVYEAVPGASAVIHIHSAIVWRQWSGLLPTTPPDAAYGTPEMAHAIRHLAGQMQNDGPGRVIIMAGHEDGVIAFGPTLDEAGRAVLTLLGEGLRA